MRRIEKGAEPRALAEFRSGPGARYEDLPSTTKEQVRSGLGGEQGWLCCYCCERVHAGYDPDGHARTKIEHHTPRSDPDQGPVLALSWANLLLACRGGEGGPKHLESCDTAKGSQRLRLHPADPVRDWTESLRFLRDGTIASRDPDIDRELNAVLRLNLQHLRDNRRAVYRAVVSVLNSRKTWTRRQLDKELETWCTPDSQGRLPPLAPVAVYVLRRRRRHAPQ